MKYALKVALVLSALAAAPAHAVMLGSDQFGNLFSVNLTTGAGALIGTELNFPLSTEIEYDTGTGTLYSEETNGSVNLHTINPATGLSTGFVTHGCCALTGMEFVGSTLYVTNIMAGGGSPSTLETINTTTGVLTPIGPTGVLNVTGLAYDAAAGIMYGVAGGGTGPNDLVSINLATGLATFIGTLIDGATGAPLTHVGSIEFGANGVLYGGTAQNATVNPGWLFSINTISGVSSFIGPTGFSITGLTETASMSVPEPGSLALLGLGLAVLGYRRRSQA